MWDRDSNGYISRLEIKAVMESMSGGHVSPEDVEEMLEKADTNKDNKISSSEFIECMK